MNHFRHFALAVAIGTILIATSKVSAEMNTQPGTSADRQQNHPYVGMWVTADGYVRHNLLPNGRYDEARGNRESAYQGRYEVRGNHIDYWDDTGFTADGEFIDGVLHHGGMILHRQK
jgi:hypothetical protein